ncbi:hypothetical protein [Streptomyces sp. MBT62]|uniref:hypothetical protein n=1 Tax=Streptomyces sp. MBT62 TaxID=2800410 RepID=UPI00190E2572|nr:hypothetical protein [Streptomyces sp. MBT62]MBK3564536.1 hypothetical protein [Streptomyces sp. MBT62]
MSRGVLTHIAAIAIGAVAGYAGAGGSTDTPATPRVTVTATSIATETSSTDSSGTAQKARSGEIPGDGTYVVGKDIKPGTYRTDGPQGGLVTNCYWARLSSTSGELRDIIANGNTMGQTTVTIAPTDKAFTTTGCNRWTKAD